MRLKRSESTLRTFYHTAITKLSHYRALLLLLAALTLILLLIAGKGSDLFIFPFESPVWGNVSDWAIVFVTIITAIYLVKTFREQQKLTKFEEVKYLKSIQPSFELSVPYRREIMFDTSMEMRITFHFTVKNSRAEKIRFSWSDNEQISFVEEVNEFDVLHPDEYIHRYQAFLSLNIYPEDGKPSIYYFNKFQLLFSDSENNTYSQHIYFTIIDDRIVIENLAVTPYTRAADSSAMG